MTEIKDKILNILSEKSLSFSDKQNWNLVLEKLPEEYCEDIFEFISKNSKGVQVLTKNLNDKLDAFEMKDIQKWEEILNDEKQLFQLNNSHDDGKKR